MGLKFDSLVGVRARGVEVGSAAGVSGELAEIQFRLDVVVDDGKGGQIVGTPGFVDHGAAVFKHLGDGHGGDFAAVIVAGFDGGFEEAAGSLSGEIIRDDEAGLALHFDPRGVGHGDVDVAAIDGEADIGGVDVAGGDGHDSAAPGAMHRLASPTVGYGEVFIHGDRVEHFRVIEKCAGGVQAELVRWRPALRAIGAARRGGERLAHRMTEARQWRGALATLLLLCACLAMWWAMRGSGVVLAATQESGARLSVRLETPDKACAACHQAIYDSYERTPMALGSGAAAQGLDDVEVKAGGFTHAGSGVTYRVTLVGGVARLTYERAAGAAEQRLAGEERLKYFVGSGKRGRTFLYDVDGLWFETPINWYTRQGAWDMAPGFSAAKDLPAPLPVDANCLHCHASEVARAMGGARNRFAGAPFGQGGVGCAACHGDAQAHLAQVKAGGGSGMLRLKNLHPVERDSVCLQCHLEGDATVYRAGRSLAEFKPGENLFDSAVYFVDRNRALQGGRASSQYEALLESACKRGAGDKLTCTTCHDPHSSPAAADRVEFFRGRCLTCHTGTAMATTHHPEERDCATCHMPTRATLDISHEQVTDHNIQAKPRKARAEERTKSFDLVPVGPVTVGAREEGLGYAQLAQHGDRTAGERALHLLKTAEKQGADDAETHDQLGFLLQISGVPGEAGAEYAKALGRDPQDTTAAANLAVLSAAGGHAGAAVGLLEQVVREDPSQTAAGLNLAFLLCRGNEKDRARAVIEQMLRFNPGSTAAQTFLQKGNYGGQTCSVR